MENKTTYIPTLWEDGQQWVDANALNNIETGIINAHENKADKTPVSASANGLMTSALLNEHTDMKTKLNGIAPNANNYVHPNDYNTRHISDVEKGKIGKVDGIETTVSKLPTKMTIVDNVLQLQDKNNNNVGEAVILPKSEDFHLDNYLYNPYEDVDSSCSTQKGQLHAHTNMSDGSLTQEQLIAEYKKNNFQFLLITDHNYIHPTITQQEGITTISGCEQTIAFEGCHIGIFDTNIKYDYNSVSSEQIMNSHKDNGSLLSFNHHSKDVYRHHDIRFLPTTNFMEIYNGKRNAFYHDDYINYLNQGQRLFHTATDDFHRIPYIDLGYIEVVAKDNKKETLKEAMRKGCFYSCIQGHNIKIELNSSKTTITATSTINSDFYIVVDGITIDGAKNSTSSVYPITGKERNYIFIYCVNSTDIYKRAYAQPIFIDAPVLQDNIDESIGNVDVGRSVLSSDTNGIYLNAKPCIINNYSIYGNYEIDDINRDIKFVSDNNNRVSLLLNNDKYILLNEPLYKGNFIKNNIYYKLYDSMVFDGSSDEMWSMKKTYPNSVVFSISVPFIRSSSRIHNSRIVDMYSNYGIRNTNVDEGDTLGIRTSTSNHTLYLQLPSKEYFSIDELRKKLAEKPMLFVAESAFAKISQLNIPLMQVKEGVQKLLVKVDSKVAPFKLEVCIKDEPIKTDVLLTNMENAFIGGGTVANDVYICGNTWRTSSNDLVSVGKDVGVRYSLNGNQKAIYNGELTVLDYILDDKVIKKSNFITFNGQYSEGWRVKRDYPASLCLQVELPNAKPEGGFYTNLFDYHPNVGNKSSNGERGCRFAPGSTILYVQFWKTLAGSFDEFMTYLSTNPLKIYYEANKEEIIPCDNLIKSDVGENNLSLLTGQVTPSVIAIKFNK